MVSLLHLPVVRDYSTKAKLTTRVAKTSKEQTKQSLSRFLLQTAVSSGSLGDVRCHMAAFTQQWFQTRGRAGQEAQFGKA